MRRAGMRRAGITLLTVATATAIGAAGAQGATVSVSGDDGNPVPLAPGVPGAVRVMAPTVEVATPGLVTVNVTGPDGAAASTTATCLFGTKRYLDYRGNGLYTVQVVEYGAKDYTCKTPIGAPATYTFAINAGIALPQPTAPFLIRAPKKYASRTLQMPVAPNPGGGSTELVYARNAKLGPDGGLLGAVQTGYVSSTTSMADLRFRVPGTYTVVARASSGTLAKSPWSAPITIRTLAPFDVQRVSFPDSRGPSYQLKGHLYDSFARGGKVHIAIARGKSGGTFRSIGSAKITRKGTFTKRFTAKTPGAYRLRYVFAGSSLVTKGKSTQRIRITRRTTFG